MRMSEFERPENEPSFAAYNASMPADFTEEDLAFAAELHALFPPDEESLPPYYVQTLLDVNDQRFDPVVRGFEYKTSAHVFRRLKLRRRIFRAHLSPVNALSISIGDASLRRSALAMVCTFVMIMLLTVAFTGSSFASGMAILLRGEHKSGVYEINQFPKGIVHASYTNNQEPSLDTKQISLLTVQQQLHFPIYWPGYSLPQYTLQHINFYVGLNQEWADGPMLEFKYSLSSSPSLKEGDKDVWVREFKPRTDVLQLVGENASVPIETDAEGRALAIYVNGQWNSSAGNGPVWIYGGRSELIYQIDGIVFWIADNTHNNLGEKDLMQIAQGLTLCCVVQHVRVADNETPVIQRSSDNFGPFSTDVIIFTSNSNDGSGPYYMSVTSSQLPKNAY